MNSRVVKPMVNRLYKISKSNVLTQEGSHLPDAYKKFYQEWKFTKPNPVHYQPVTQEWVRNPDTDEVKRVQDYHIPLIFPPESHDGIWGGEGVIKGFRKPNPLSRRVPHWWVPNLKQSAVYSEILNETMEVTLTERTISLIIKSFGFDHYLLKNKACDLQSLLALKLKKKMLLALYHKDLYPNNAAKREEVYKKYKHYLDGYTLEDIEWYGLSFDEALSKAHQLTDVSNEPQPLKHQFREELITKLKEAKLEVEAEDQSSPVSSSASWLSKINPFSKKS